MTAINVTARRIKKGSKTFVEVRGLGASRNAVALLGGKRAERATAVVVCERAPYRADDPIRLGLSGGDRPDFGSHPLHAVGLRANAVAARREAHRLLHPALPSRRAIRCQPLRPAAYAAAIDIVDETEPQPEPAKEPTLVDYLVEFGLELTREANGISVYVRDNVQVSIDTVYGGVEVVALESDGFTEKRRLALPASQWPVHAAAEIVRAVLSERHS